MPATHTAVCPPKRLIVDFSRGKLDDAAAETVSAHLETCIECRAAAADVAADSFIQRLRAAHGQISAAAPLSSQADSVSRANSNTATCESPQSSPSTPAEPSVPPELIDHPDYELVKELGRGGMGVVYLARNRAMDRLEVLKVVSRSLLEKADARERFQREIRSAAKLSHPNIVTAHSVPRAGDLLIFAMEYVDGQDLSQVVKQRGPLPVISAAYYAHQAALGLQHAHEHGMVHRDIKPNNLILSVQAKRHLVKILDFGLAKATSEKIANSELTGSGQILGTPDYMAPEQSLDSQNADIRADIYSLGCTLYYMLAGRPPFEGASVFALLAAHHSTTARLLSDIRADVPVELAAVVAKMMAKDPAHRYQTPAEVSQALGPFYRASGGEAAQLAPIAVPLAPPLAAVEALATAPPMPPEFSPARNALARAERAMASLPTRLGAHRLPPAVRYTALGSFAALIVLCVVVIKLSTPDGELTVEFNKPTAKQEVTIEQNGRKILTAKLEPAAKTTPARPPPKATESEHHGNKPWESAAFRQWMNEVAAVPAEQQVEAVVKKLRQFNPGFDGKEAHEIDNKVVTELHFSADAVTDISPLRALRGLKRLECGGSDQEKGILSDLSPLAGMRLTELSCWGNGRLSDLSPLNGMPLTELYCDKTAVADLRPLEGMSLTELHCGNTLISDLSPLHGMPLALLYCERTRVSDLSPLKGMPLRRLLCWGTHVSSLAPLEGMQLSWLMCGGGTFSDLSPLKGMKLTELWCDETRVFDLSPLEGMPLHKLVCWGAPVSDLSPLRGMPLEVLWCHGTKVSDLSPLDGMRLTSVVFTPRNITKGTDALRRMKSIKTIGIDVNHEDQLPPDEFWRKYDAGEFGKPDSKTATPDHKPNPTSNDPAFAQWAKRVAARPAEQRVKAVAEKLQDLNPGFDGKLTGYGGRGPPKIENSVVTELGFSTAHVTDIPPLRTWLG